MNQGQLSARVSGQGFAIVPTQIHINEDSQFTSVHIDGSVSVNELQTLLNTVLEDEAFQVNWPQLVDLRGARLESEGYNLQVLLNSIYTQYRPNINAAMAVILDGSIDGELFAQVYRFICNIPNTELFDDYAQALKWLISQNGSTPSYLLKHPNPGAQNSHQYPAEKRA
jgi:hypothetical protein